MANSDNSNSSFFQKAWWIKLGQVDEQGAFTESYKTSELDFEANIDYSAESASGSETPQVSVVKIYNLGRDVIKMIGGNYKLYIKINAGYVMNNGVKNPNPDELPEIYLGFIHYSNTYTDGVDIITEIHCTPAFDKLATATINKEFNKGTYVKDIFSALALAAKLPIKMDFKEMNTRKLKTSKTVEGGVSQKLTEWCRFVDAINYVDRGVLYIVNEKTKVQGHFTHNVPLSMVKGYVSLSVDVAKVIKKGHPRSPDVEFTTFLYPAISLRDVVDVEVPDYNQATEVDQVPIINHQFVVTAYSHNLASEAGGAWETHISGKGSQEDEEDTANGS